MVKKLDSDAAKIVGFLGVGLDNPDGHDRISHSEHFLLVGGSHETHEHMQETAIKFSEKLKGRGKALPEASLKEVIDLFLSSQE